MLKPLKFRRTGTPSAGVFGRAAEHRVQLARAALFYERLWPRAWPLIGLVLVFLGIAWFDLWRFVPGYVHGLLLLPFAGLAALGLWHLWRGVRWPSRAEGIARLEHDSGLSHRPLRTLSDSLALGRQDPASEALWRAHLKRASGALGEVRVKPPRPDIPRADPYGLRVLAVAFALLGLLYAGPDWQARLGAAFNPEINLKTGPGTLLEAWITPPTYTQKPPIYLERAGASTSRGRLLVPQGSVLSVHMAGARRPPHIKRHVRSAAGAPKDWRTALSMTADGTKNFKIDLPLTISQSVEVFAGPRRVGRWDIALIPDKPPIIAFKDPPRANDKNLVGISFTAGDDYGVATAEVRIQPAKPAEAASGADQDLALTDVNQPLVVPLSLPPGHPKSVTAKQFLDLTAHPWAGLPVTVTLAATDDAGQTSLSAPQNFVLPEREFHDPLARAIIEQRRILAAAPRANTERVREALDALTLAPERFTPDIVVYLGLRDAYYRLGNELTKDSLQSVYDLFWNLALHIEDGDLTLAEQALRDIQNKLMDALSNNASDDEIQGLMAQLKDALDRYMQALEQQAQKAMAQGQPMPQVARNGNVVTADDFKTLMQAIEDMAKTGARGAARDMLAQLQNILDNLRVGGGNGQMTAGEQAMSNALKGLTDILKDQKTLLDQTYRRSGRGAAPSKEDPTASQLARNQAELRERLDKLTSKLGQNMPSGLQSFDRASSAMGNAQDALGGGDADAAVSPESQAIDALQQGMQGLAQALAQSMGGRLAVGQGQGSDRDPMGRRMGGMGAITDDGVQVPTDMQLQRARKILQEIQRRASERNRDPKELQYLDRLLKRFN